MLPEELNKFNQPRLQPREYLISGNCTASIYISLLLIFFSFQIKVYTLSINPSFRPSLHPSNPTFINNFFLNNTKSFHEWPNWSDYKMIIRSMTITVPPPSPLLSFVCLFYSLGIKAKHSKVWNDWRENSGIWFLRGSNIETKNIETEINSTIKLTLVLLEGAETLLSFSSGIRENQNFWTE